MTKGYSVSNMLDNARPQLSKTRFGGGLQCLKRLWLNYYSPELADQRDAGQQALLDVDTAVGALARQRFPEGLLIAEPYNEHARAELHTSEVIADSTVPAIYEAAFTFDGIRIRVDVLSRVNGNSFDLVEVKSSTSVKQEHIPDTAIQLYVLEGCDVDIEKVSLLHVDNSYVYEGGPYDLDELFRVEDITDRARTFLSSIPASLVDMSEVLHQDKVPLIEIGSQCTRPYRCPFYGYCREDTPEHHIEQLPRVGPKLMEKLRAANILDIRDIPPGFPSVSANQQRVRDSVVSGQPYIGPELSPALDEVIYPLYFLDFETFNPALPVYPGTRPYQVIPFQWSLHVRDSPGNLSHASFLYEGSEDPREHFLTSLLDSIGPVGTIAVYSGYEERIIKQLAQEFPRYEVPLLALCDRLLDLLGVVRSHYYHPNFHGSYSIKAVLPALVPDMTYSDLEIQDGLSAGAAFAEMIAPGTEESKRERIRRALIDYCRRDTQAMVQLLETLLTLGKAGPSQQ